MKSQTQNEVSNVTHVVTTKTVTVSKNESSEQLQDAIERYEKRKSARPSGLQSTSTVVKTQQLEASNVRGSMLQQSRMSQNAQEVVEKYRGTAYKTTYERTGTVDQQQTNVTSFRQTNFAAAPEEQSQFFIQEQQPNEFIQQQTVRRTRQTVESDYNEMDNKNTFYKQAQREIGDIDTDPLDSDYISCNIF